MAKILVYRIQNRKTKHGPYAEMDNIASAIEKNKKHPAFHGNMWVCNLSGFTSIEKLVEWFSYPFLSKMIKQYQIICFKVDKSYVEYPSKWDKTGQVKVDVKGFSYIDFMMDVTEIVMNEAKRKN